MIARTREGHEVLSFIACENPIIPDEDQHIPLTFSIIVPRHQEQLLILYTHERQNWEFPGGGMEADETPYDCAIRELFEETRQVAHDITLKGIFKIALQPDMRLEYGALYTATLADLQPFVENAEAARIMLWNSEDALDDAFSSLSGILLGFC